jgi:hypothetical protein
MSTDIRHDLGRGGGAAISILGVIAIALLLAGIWYAAFGRGRGTFDDLTDQLDELGSSAASAVRDALPS